MDQNIIVFVCEHGAAKSIVAATYFNELAKQLGLDLKAVARGTNPDSQLSQATIQGLSSDGLLPNQSMPRQLSLEDIQSARRIVSFCELPIEYQRRDGQPSIPTTEQWDDIPPVSENYEKARDAILKHLNHLLGYLRSSP